MKMYMNSHQPSPQGERKIDIMTPEHVQLRFKTAGLGTRGVALIIDLFILFFINILVFTAFLLTTDIMFELMWPSSGGYALALFIIIFFVLNWAYFIFQEHLMRGQTFGKKTMGLRVLSDNGQSMTFLSNIIRNFFRFVDLMMPIVGILCMFFHPHDKRLGDMIAKTIVVIDHDRQKKSGSKQKQKLLKKYAGSLPDLQLSEHARQKITRDEWQLLATWVERYLSMNKEKKQMLSMQLAKRFDQIIADDSQNGYDRSLPTERPVEFLLAVYLQLREDWEF
jgi:uncharacterized RDD family membrane protein YckC